MPWQPNPGPPPQPEALTSCGQTPPPPSWLQKVMQPPRNIFWLGCKPPPPRAVVLFESTDLQPEHRTMGLLLLGRSPSEPNQLRDASACTAPQTWGSKAPGPCVPISTSPPPLEQFSKVTSKLGRLPVLEMEQCRHSYPQNSTPPPLPQPPPAPPPEHIVESTGQCNLPSLMRPAPAPVNGDVVRKPQIETFKHHIDNFGTPNSSHDKRQAVGTSPRAEGVSGWAPPAWTGPHESH